MQLWVLLWIITCPRLFIDDLRMLLGYQGMCWRCGQVGHKANECTVGINEMENEGGDQEECSVEIGRIWNLCPVVVLHSSSLKFKIPLH